MKDNPLVSIIISNYNYGHFLREAIESALNQTYLDSEVIVVDDGSTDKSREIILSYGDRIVPVLKGNGGQASAFNAGFVASQGDIICFLDSDDSFLPEKLAEIVNIFKSYKDVGWCFHLLSLVNISTNIFFKKRCNYPSNEWDLRSQIKNGKKITFAPCATSSLCFTSLLLRKILPMPEAITITSDNYLKFTALALSKGFFLNKELAIQKIHSNNNYTLRNDKQQLRAKVFIFTAYWMRVNFPFLFRFTDSLFVCGIVNYWQTGSLESECREVIEDYFSSTGFIGRLKISFRAFYYFIKELCGYQSKLRKDVQ